MHHLSPALPKKKVYLYTGRRDVKALVRFFALLRINHILHRLCGPPSIPLSFNLAIVLPRWDTYCVNCGTEGVSPPTPSIHRLPAWTTRVSNPVCSPRFRASASVAVQQAAFATGVPPYIYAFHRYTRNSACPLQYSRSTVSNAGYGLSP